MTSRIELDERFAGGFINVGAKLLVICGVAIAVAFFVQSHVEITGYVTASIHLVAAFLHGFGVAFAAVAVFLIFAGGLFKVVRRLGRIGTTVVVVAAVSAAVAFVFTPICWSPKSDDCRSIVQRVADAF